VAVSTSWQAMYYPEMWRPLSEFLLALGAGSGTASPAEALAAITRTSTSLGARARGEDYPSVGGALASLCVDARPSGPATRYPWFADREDAKAPYFGRLRTWTGVFCESWKLRDTDNVTGPWRQTTRADILTIGTRYDPATPYSQTRPYTRLFPNGHMLTVEGYGHTILPPNVSVCANDVVTAYLVEGTTPKPGATCQQDLDPFAPAPSSTLRQQAPAPLPPVPFL